MNILNLAIRHLRRSLAKRDAMIGRALCSILGAAVLLEGCAPVPSLPSRHPAAGLVVLHVSPTQLLSTPAAAGMSDALGMRSGSVILAGITDRVGRGGAVAVGGHGRLVHRRGYGRIDWAAGSTPSRSTRAGHWLSPWSVGHTGFTGTSIRVDPHADLFVIPLTNRVNPSRDDPRSDPLRRAVAETVREAVRDKPLRDRGRDYADRPEP
jgi:hypothetical protein